MFGKGSGLRVVSYFLDGKADDVAVCRELHSQGSQDFTTSLAYLGHIHRVSSHDQEEIRVTLLHSHSLPVLEAYTTLKGLNETENTNSFCFQA